MIITGAALMIGSKVFAQEYKLAKSSGRLEIKEVNQVMIEGYDGKEITFSSLDKAREKDERAAGLKAINSMGLDDNTGLGLSVVDKGNVVEVYQLKKIDGPRVKIQVPKGVIVSYNHSSSYGSKVSFKNLENELEVSTLHSGIELENVTGPLTIKTVHGKVEVNLSNNTKTPVSIVSVHGLIDVTLPVAAKANLTMGTQYGEIYVDPAFKIDFEKKNDEWVTYGSGKVKGTLNGGGLDITLSSSHGNIYLRKK